MTNFEKVKAKITIEQMAEIIESEMIFTACDRCVYYNKKRDCQNDDCEYGIKKWLESEVKE